MSFNGLSIEVVQWSCYLEKLYSRTHSAINCRYYTPEDINDLKEKFERIEHQKKEDEKSLQNMELYWKVQVARIVPGASCTDCEEDELDEYYAEFGEHCELLRLVDGRPRLKYMFWKYLRCCDGLIGAPHQVRKCPRYFASAF